MNLAAWCLGRPHGQLPGWDVPGLRQPAGPGVGGQAAVSAQELDSDQDRCAAAGVPEDRRNYRKTEAEMLSMMRRRLRDVALRPCLRVPRNPETNCKCLQWWREIGKPPIAGHQEAQARRGTVGRLAPEPGRQRAATTCPTQRAQPPGQTESRLLRPNPGIITTPGEVPIAGLESYATNGLAVPTRDAAPPAAKAGWSRHLTRRCSTSAPRQSERKEAPERDTIVDGSMNLAAWCLGRPHVSHRQTAVLWYEGAIDDDIFAAGPT